MTYIKPSETIVWSALAQTKNYIWRQSKGEKQSKNIIPQNYQQPDYYYNILDQNCLTTSPLTTHLFYSSHILILIPIMPPALHYVTSTQEQLVHLPFNKFFISMYQSHFNIPKWVHEGRHFIMFKMVDFSYCSSMYHLAYDTVNNSSTFISNLFS